MLEILILTAFKVVIAVELSSKNETVIGVVVEGKVKIVVSVKVSPVAAGVSAEESISENNAPGTQGKNTGGKAQYTGPCPPDREHRYFFKLYALDTMLTLKEGATKAQVLEAIKGHVIAEAELMGKYQRK